MGIFLAKEKHRRETRFHVAIDAFCQQIFNPYISDGDSLSNHQAFVLMHSKVFIRLLIVLGLMPAIGFPQTYTINHNQDILHYTFNITLNDTTNEIAGVATITFSLKDTEDLVLDLINRGINNKGMTVDQITLANNDLAFVHVHDKLKVDIDTTTTNPLKIIIYYHGVPADGLIIGNNKFGEREFFGDNYPDRARNWLPCVDHPADKASVTWQINAPDHYRVVANGKFAGKKPLANHYLTTKWDETVPISTKVMVFGAANFSVDHTGDLRNIPVTSWVYQQNKAAGFHDYKPALEILTYFDSLIAPYPFEKLANVQSNTRYGGMENAGNIFYAEASVDGKGGHETLIAHEIVHQWFGNSATEKDWPHAWLSEGFATYLTHAYIGSRKGKTVMQARLKKDRGRVIQYWHQQPLPIVNTGLVTYPRVANMRALLNTNTYQKASWVLHMLHRELGDAVFWQAVREYYAVYKTNVANTSDFQKIVEAVSKKNLQPFFEQWFFSEGQPILQGAWTYTKGEVTVIINQRQEKPFIFPIDLGFVYNNEIIIKKIAVSTIGESFTIPGHKPKKILVDPNCNLLFEGPAELTFKK